MSIKEELKKLKNEGLLNPHSVIEYAENKDTALHSCFEWDNEKAGYEYRLWQARQLIVRINVKILNKNNETIMVQAYHSLEEDRNSEGGYRFIPDILSDKERRQQLLNQAIKDFEYFEQKYKMLEELSELFKVGKKLKN